MPLGVADPEVVGRLTPFAFCALVNIVVVGLGSAYRG